MAKTYKITEGTKNKLKSLIDQDSISQSPSSTQKQSDVIVYVYNNTGSAVGRLSILGISGVQITPTANLEQFLRKPVFTGNTPDSEDHSDGRFVICLEPIAAGGIGRCLVSGIVAVTINVTDESHVYADITDGDESKLTSADSGPCVILWKESGTGSKYAIIRFGSSGGSSEAEIQYAIVTQTPEYNEPTKAKFIVQRASVNESGEWEGDEDDIDIDRALGFEGFVEHEGNSNAKDIRNWHPWPAAGSIVPIIQKWDADIDDYRLYMDIDMAYGGVETVSSLRVDDETLLTQAVWA